MSDIHDDEASSEHIDDKPTTASEHVVPQEGALVPPPDELTSTEAVGWRVRRRELVRAAHASQTWAIAFTGAMQDWNFAHNGRYIARLSDLPPCRAQQERHSHRRRPRLVDRHGQFRHRDHAPLVRVQLPLHLGVRRSLLSACD